MFQRKKRGCGHWTRPLGKPAAIVFQGPVARGGRLCGASIDEAYAFLGAAGGGALGESNLGCRGGATMVEPVLIAQGRCLQAPRREVHAELGGWGST